MNLFCHTIIDLIKKSAYWADRSIRSELSIGLIADENDYTSNFTAEFRRQINAKAISGLTAISYKVNGSIERKTGADACIILSNHSEAKMCLFEAKLPRLSTKVNAWDSIQKSTSQSHFSSQLQRQKRYKSCFAIWEMFYCDNEFKKQPAPFLDFVSSCITHDEAFNYDDLSRSNRYAAWTDSELIDMHDKSTIYQVDDLIESVCMCNMGTRINVHRVNGLLSELERTVDVLSISYDDSNENS
ncbi:hypothetical protein MGMO_35c00190 [Methyloglobulus morosus KoM1]|uniref:Uncharacterized protein n=1 Tax=Methyloglobulus morosus KoM1 TaxID=1116472 RepID=V5C8T3_9GAMM|nr:hypothetical protein [Methyloglobulus morosus]ESS73123.1 hypothetical protein MGMO_35c00190 [Methyloglobulus morosus KoM1]